MMGSARGHDPLNEALKAMADCKSFVAAVEEEALRTQELPGQGGGGHPGDEDRVFTDRVRGAVDDFRRAVVVADMHVRTGIRQWEETRKSVHDLEAANASLRNQAERATGDAAMLEEQLDECEKEVAALREQLYLQVDAEEAIRAVSACNANVRELETSMATLVTSLRTATSQGGTPPA
ncbi:hypothetical protein T484DRAFT_2026286, partial [Baffinella frigidus]